MARLSDEELERLAAEGHDGECGVDTRVQPMAQELLAARKLAAEANATGERTDYDEATFKLVSLLTEGVK